MAEVTMKKGPLAGLMDSKNVKKGIFWTVIGVSAVLFLAVFAFFSWTAGHVMGKAARNPSAPQFLPPIPMAGMTNVSRNEWLEIPLPDYHKLKCDNVTPEMVLEVVLFDNNGNRLTFISYPRHWPESLKIQPDGSLKNERQKFGMAVAVWIRIADLCRIDTGVIKYEVLPDPVYDTVHTRT